MAFSFAIVERGLDAYYLTDLVSLGGPRFLAAVSFVGINVYPGVWPPVLDDPHWDVVRYMDSAHGTTGHAGFAESLTLDILENGYPSVDAESQADRLDAFVSAVVNHGPTFGASSYS